MNEQTDNIEIHFSHSQEVDKFFDALAKAQVEFKPVLRGCTNPFFKSKYADLQNVIDATKEALSKHGLAAIQLPGVAQAAVVVTTFLGHSSGQWFASTLKMPAAKPDAQGIGSAITYARRYSLQSLLGVAAEEDDDGNGAVSKPKEDRKPAAKAPAPESKSDPLPGEKRVPFGITNPQRQRMFAISKTHGWADNEFRNLLGQFGFESTAEVTTAKYDEICSELEKRKAIPA